MLNERRTEYPRGYFERKNRHHHTTQYREIKALKKNYIYIYILYILYIYIYILYILYIHIYIYIHISNVRKLHGEMQFV